MPRFPPAPPKPRHEVPWTLWGPGLENGGAGALPGGAQSTEQTFHRLYLRVFIKCGRLKKNKTIKMHFLGVGGSFKSN